MIFELKQDLSTKHGNLPATSSKFIKVVSVGSKCKQSDFDFGQGTQVIRNCTPELIFSGINF